MKKLAWIVVIAGVLTFGAAVAIPHFGAHSAGNKVAVAKYPHVPDKEFLDEIVPGDDGKVCVSVDKDGEHLGLKVIDSVDFADRDAPTWAKQAAIGAAITSIETDYNASVAQGAESGDGLASAAYVKFCVDCGSGPNCCEWDCHGLISPTTHFCVDYRAGNCVAHRIACLGNLQTCGFCDYIDPP